MDESKVVKCACGLPMRQKDWSDHWRSCYKGSSVPVLQEDIDNLLYYEEKRAEAVRKHSEWKDEFDNRWKTQGRL